MVASGIILTVSGPGIWRGDADKAGYTENNGYLVPDEFKEELDRIMSAL
jgi:hypothetical protein